MNATNIEIELISDAAEWRLISLLFECPVGEWKAVLCDLSSEVSDPELKRAADLAQIQASEGIYHSIFGPGGPAPGREISYRDWAQPGYLLSELRAFYDAFSFELPVREAPDHIAVETAFVAYLKLKEAYALGSGEADNAEIASRASKSFIAEHLTKVAGRISSVLADSGFEYLALASAALLKRVGPDTDAKRRSILPVLPLDDDEMIECPAV